MNSPAGALGLGKGSSGGGGQREALESLALGESWREHLRER